MDFAWMAWTGPTALFFAIIAGLIAGMTLWEYFSPGGAPRDSFLGLRTTRGDRLFISLLGSAFIALGWLALGVMPMAWSLVLCAAFFVFVFRFC
jgi:predicted small integral membrane protein